MAPLPPQSTLRYFLDYNGPMGERSVQFRFGAIADDQTAIDYINALLVAVRPLIYSSVSFYRLRRASDESVFSFPVPWLAVSGAAAGTLQAQDYPVFMSFVGRSSGGRRVRKTFYGVTFRPDDNYRIQRAENVNIDNAIGVLLDTPPSEVAIDSSPVIWNEYVNTGFNAYYQRQARRT